jgi:molybdopterin converting factor small subunit
MEIRVRSMGPLQQVLGGPQTVLSLPDGATVGDLLDRMAEEKGETFALYVRKAKEKTVYAALRLVVNGRDLLPGQYETVTLSEGDDVLVFTPIAGG